MFRPPSSVAGGSAPGAEGPDRWDVSGSRPLVTAVAGRRACAVAFFFFRCARAFVACVDAPAALAAARGLVDEAEVAPWSADPARCSVETVVLRSVVDVLVSLDVAPAWPGAAPS